MRRSRTGRPSVSTGCTTKSVLGEHWAAGRADSLARCRAAGAPILALVAVTAIWGYTFVPVQKALDAYPLFAFLAVRFAISGLALAPVAWSPLRTLPRAGWAAGTLAGGFLAAAYAFQTAGLDLTTVSSTGFITGLYVVFTPILALVLFRTPVPGCSVGRRRALARRARPDQRDAGRLGCREPARARERPRPVVPDRRDGALRATLRRARPRVPPDDASRAPRSS